MQDWLNASDAGAFDLSAACSGFVYGMQLASDSIRAGSIESALIIGAETMSRIIDWTDRSTCILFGDGAGAVVLRASDAPGGVLSSVLRSDGAGGDLLAIPSVGSIDAPDSPASGNGSQRYKISMAGGEVFKFATRVVSESIDQACKLAQVKVEEIDLVIPHQANRRILQSAARKLGIDIAKFMSNVERYGNTSAASIPIALCEAIEQRAHPQPRPYRAGRLWRRLDLGIHGHPLGRAQTQRAAWLALEAAAAACAVSHCQAAAHAPAHVQALPGRAELEKRFRCSLKLLRFFFSNLGVPCRGVSLRRP